LSKGIGPFGVFIIGLLGAIVIFGIIFFSLQNRASVTKRAFMEINILDGINKFELTEKAMEKSLEYSYYEASYLTGKRGGYYTLDGVDSDEGFPYWRIHERKIYPGFLHTEKLTALALNNYGEQIDGEIDIPEYDRVTIEEIALTGARLETSSGKLILERDKLEIEDNSLEISLETKIPRLYSLGKERFLDGDHIQNSLKQSTINMPVSTCQIIGIGDVCGSLDNIDHEAVLSEHCRDAEGRGWSEILTDRIKFEISKLNLDEGDIDVTITLAEDDIDVSYEATCFSDGETIENDPSCQCEESWRYDCGGSSTSESSCTVDEKGIGCAPCYEESNIIPGTYYYSGCYCRNPFAPIGCQLTSCFGCVRHQDKHTLVTCVYEYHASARVFVEIRDKSGDLYPVYDNGRASLEEMFLNFWALSSDSYGHGTPPETDSNDNTVTVIDVREPTTPTTLPPGPVSYIDNFLASKSPDSPLIGLCDCISKASEESEIPMAVFYSIPINEGGYSGTSLQKDCNNLYSIKGTGCPVTTWECYDTDVGGCKPPGDPANRCGTKWDCTVQDEFQRYTSKCDSVNGFVNLMKSPRYWEGAGNCEPVKDYLYDPKKFVEAVGNCGYATDPIWYIKVGRIIDEITPYLRCKLPIPNPGEANSIEAIAREAIGHPYCLGADLWDKSSSPPSGPDCGTSRGYTCDNTGKCPTDCSAFTQWVFNRYTYIHGFDDLISTPTAYWQANNAGSVVDGHPDCYGDCSPVSVDKNTIREEDLIFFCGTYDNNGNDIVSCRDDGITHVGIYLGDGQFIHASTSGVVVADIDTSSLRSKYAGSVRVIGG
jgi:cell wall-associated NlpC family hydrolase